jgi:hypothetical protein
VAFLANNVMMMTGGAENVARVALGVIDYGNQFELGEKLKRAVYADETQLTIFLL